MRLMMARGLETGKILEIMACFACICEKIETGASTQYFVQQESVDARSTHERTTTLSRRVLVPILDQILQYYRKNF